MIITQMPTASYVEGVGTTAKEDKHRLGRAEVAEIRLDSTTTLVRPCVRDALLENITMHKSHQADGTRKQIEVHG